MSFVRGFRRFVERTTEITLFLVFSPRLSVLFLSFSTSVFLVFCLSFDFNSCLTIYQVRNRSVSSDFIAEKKAPGEEKGSSRSETMKKGGQRLKRFPSTTLRVMWGKSWAWWLLFPPAEGAEGDEREINEVRKLGHFVIGRILLFRQKKEEKRREKGNKCVHPFHRK